MGYFGVRLVARKETAMMGSVKLAGAVALGLVLGLSSAANAQAVHHHPRHPAHPAPAGRQITVYANESYLTAGTGASVGEYNGYALDTLSPPGTYLPFVDHTTVGLRGQNRLPNNFTVPGCCGP